MRSDYVSFSFFNHASNGWNTLYVMLATCSGRMCCLLLQVKARVNHLASQMFNWQPSSSLQHFQERCSYNSAKYMQYVPTTAVHYQIIISIFDHLHDHTHDYLLPQQHECHMWQHCWAMQMLCLHHLHIWIQNRRYNVLKPGVWRRSLIKKCQH